MIETTQGKLETRSRCRHQKRDDSYLFLLLLSAYMLLLTISNKHTHRQAHNTGVCYLYLNLLQRAENVSSKISADIQ